ncbi:hypothetical protein EMCRGX_G001164 [Ephydatia muelleri]
MLPKCVLPSLKSKGHHFKHTPIKVLCDLWAKNEFSTLWNLAGSNARKAPSQQKHRNSKSLSDSVISLAKIGLHGKACRILLPDGLAPLNNSTWELLKSNTPPDVPCTPLSLGPDFNILPILFSFPKGTAAGPSGLRIIDAIDADDDCLHLILQAWYLDDGVLAGPRQAVLRALSIIEDLGPPLDNHHLIHAVNTFNSLVSTSDAISPESAIESPPLQRSLSYKLDSLTHSSLYDLASPANKARLLSASASLATSWVSVLPSGEPGLHFDHREFRTAISWWLGLETTTASCCLLCPEIALDPLGHHALSCRRGGDVVLRHNQLRDVFVDICHKANLGVKIEAGTAALLAEQRKHQENDPKCDTLGWKCIPLAVESYGNWGFEARQAFPQLASRLSFGIGHQKSKLLVDIYGRLNVTLVRCNARALLSRACNLF